jgi:hypothetical protein
MEILTLTEKELRQIPVGRPLPSVCPSEGYGNHSCSQCMATTFCVAPWRESLGETVPNMCSLYWPPSAPTLTREQWDEFMSAVVNARPATLEEL